MSRNWSGRRDSNPRPRPWQGRALPLSYTRVRWIYGRAMSAAKAEPIPRSTAPMQPVAKGAELVAGGPLCPRALARRGAHPAGVHVTKTAIPGQNVGLACRERPILAIFVDVAGSDIDVGAPGALGGPRRAGVKRHNGNDDCHNRENAHHLLPLLFSAILTRRPPEYCPQCQPRPTSSSPRSIVS